MDFFAQLFRDCGWWYAIMLVGSFAVGLIILVVSLIRHLKRSAWTTLILALLPFAVGLFGTYEANRAIQSVLDSSGVQAKPDEVNDAYGAARRTTYVGAVLSIVLLPFAFAAIVPCCRLRAPTTGDAPGR